MSFYRKGNQGWSGKATISLFGIRECEFVMVGAVF